MKKIAFSGSFDPITQGHLWVIQEGLTLADEITIFVAENVSKQTWFNAQERCAIISASCESLNLQPHQKIHIEIVRGEYVAKAALARGIPYLIRGIRSTNDYDYENLLQQTNTEVLQGAKTIFVMPPRDLGSVSSSFIKAFIGPVGWHWQIKRFLPLPAYIALIEAWLKKQWLTLIETNQSEWENHFKVLINYYQQPHRYYHNLEHIVHCISELQRMMLPIGQHKLLLAAIFFHDVMYRDPVSPATKENISISDEEQSAAFAQNMLQGFFTPAEIEQVCNLILATAHFTKQPSSPKTNQLQAAHQAPIQDLIDVIQSIDLAILGQEEKIYQQYAGQVRAEYRDIPETIYYQSRIKVLQLFLSQANQGKLYASQDVATRYTATAIRNLQSEISQLQLANPTEATANHNQG